MEVGLIAKKNISGYELKIYGSFKKPLFLAKDVAVWINSFKKYQKKDILKMFDSLKNSEKIKGNIKGNSNNIYWFLNEEGVYKILMQVKKEIAKKFRKKLREILKSPSETKIYSADEIKEIKGNPKESKEEILAKALLIAEKTLKEKTREIESLKSERDENKPKVIFADAVESSKYSILVGDLAKIIKQKGYDIGQKRLFEWLRENGYLIKLGDSCNMPTQKSMELKLFEIKESLVTYSDGSQGIVKTPKVTGKGQVYFINRFIKKLYEKLYGDDVING